LIHSFFVPELRLKQDIVPGMTQFSWFNSNQTGDIEILCTELCGWGHYKMVADMRLVDRPEFDAWLAEQQSAYSPKFKEPQESESEPDVAMLGAEKLKAIQIEK